VPEPTPERAGRAARPGSRFLSDTLAANVRAFRARRRFNQEDLAERMGWLGHRWIRVTVSQVERGRRNLTVDELLGLALVLDATPEELLDPMGVDGDDWRALDYGPAAIPPERAREWLRSEVRIGMLDDGRFRIAPATREPTSTAGLVVEADLVAPEGEP
jgi:transcriptional regulator with XRE-family HTH domain